MSAKITIAAVLLALVGDLIAAFTSSGPVLAIQLAIAVVLIICTSVIFFSLRR